MDWLKKIIGKNTQRIGLRWEGNQLSYCVFNPNGDDRLFSAAERIDFEESKAESTLIERINDLGIKNAEAYWVLSSDQYRLLTLDRPAVPESELANAIRWQVKDQIDFELEDAAIEYFSYPKGLPGSNQVYVVVTHRKHIEKIVSLTQAADLELKAIDISELALGNVILPQLHEGQNIAFIAEHPGGLSVNCYYGQEFVFTRWLPDVYLPRSQSDDELTLDLDIDRSQDYDRLLLEIQRTLDYYEGQISRQAVTRLVIPALGDQTETIIELFGSNLGLPVDVLNLEDICRWTAPVDEFSMHTNLVVCGAVLRGEDLKSASGNSESDGAEVMHAAN